MFAFNLGSLSTVKFRTDGKIKFINIFLCCHVTDVFSGFFGFLCVYFLRMHRMNQHDAETPLSVQQVQMLSIKFSL